MRLLGSSASRNPTISHSSKRWAEMSPVHFLSGPKATHLPCRPQGELHAPPSPMRTWRAYWTRCRRGRCLPGEKG